MKCVRHCEWHRLSSSRWSAPYALSPSRMIADARSRRPCAQFMRDHNGPTSVLRLDGWGGGVGEPGLLARLGKWESGLPKPLPLPVPQLDTYMLCYAPQSCVPAHLPSLTFRQVSIPQSECFTLFDTGSVRPLVCAREAHSFSSCFALVCMWGMSCFHTAPWDPTSPRGALWQGPTAHRDAVVLPLEWLRPAQCRPKEGHA